MWRGFTLDYFVVSLFFYSFSDVHYVHIVVVFLYFSDGHYVHIVFFFYISVYE